MDNALTVYFSTGAFRNNSLVEILNYCVRYGIRNLELSSGVKPAPTYLETLAMFRDECQFLVHNYFPPPQIPFVLNLAATDKGTLRQSRDHCRAAIDLCMTLGSPFYSVHSGFALNLTPELLGKPRQQSRLSSEYIIKPEIAYETFAESVDYLSRYAESRGVGLLVENNVVTTAHVTAGKAGALLMVRAEEILRLMADISCPNLGVLVDVGHLKVSANALGYSPDSFISEIRPYIRAFHLSDNDGQTDQNRLVSKSSWFWPAVRQFPDATIVLEAYNLIEAEISEQRMVIEGALKK